MQLNLKWVIIGAVSIILVVALGHNPGDESQRAQEEATNSPDALIKAIEEYNSQGGGLSRFGAGIPGGSAFPLPTGTGDNSRHYPSYLTKDTNPFEKGLDQPPAVSPSPVPSPVIAPPPSSDTYNAPTAPSPDSYYPPPPENAPGRPHSSLQKRLTTGQPLEFAGTRVFTLDAKGKRVPMPDGVYKMEGSQLTLIIRGGHKIVVQ